MVVPYFQCSGQNLQSHSSLPPALPLLSNASANFVDSTFKIYLQCDLTVSMLQVTSLSVSSSWSPYITLTFLQPFLKAAAKILWKWKTCFFFAQHFPKVFYFPQGKNPKSLKCLHVFKIWALCYFTDLICHCFTHSFGSSHSGLLAASQACKLCTLFRTFAALLLSGMSFPDILSRHSFISSRPVVKTVSGLPISGVPLFLAWVYWCTAVKPLVLTSLTAVCHHVTKFCPIKVSSCISF